VRSGAPPEWIEQTGVIEAACSEVTESVVFVGGRFIFATEPEEDRLVPELGIRGWTLCDSGQCEVVAGRVISSTLEAVRNLIRELRETAGELGIRLESVELGDPDGGDATVLASEAGYRPWWSV
jgi:hypothetical protein